LGNILNAQAPNEVITFLTEADKAMFKKWRGPSFEVQVGIHELLGHGSGKLLEQDKDGHFNFDQAHPPIHPETGKPVGTWYKSGETYSSKFGAIASSYEECRAECCGIYLSTDPGVLKIFGHADSQEANDVMYTNWLSMARAGLLALEFYNASSKTWGQAHMRARFAILRVMLEAGNGFVNIEQHLDQHEAIIHVDRQKINSVGKKAVGDFLQRLQVYKATADFAAASAMYDKYTTVPDDWLPLRDLVIEKRQPRKIFVQPNTSVDAKGAVTMKEYDATPAGMIQSFVERQV